ncbi:hypothetical protein [Pediococcus claussenii]|uniref:Uncharacterized protein n=1 Tax=Pediococcus claussenii (strain ATCC BAA-344 / DSM 14800 / JCM 18046 / KCTC 3811 / LMG 21948 / P06) TaxID=701521 RepID=G8PAB4_PEDCP|nr:hypothetical protein [Pediococcus claussenii]AEV94553.1 hypothetical protein PECL_230 [Pediococcus claussenii ATCC BAA-344]ANZ69768.1 hypothetical protein AYR57_05300 [Pediococcus claussenii]ANZ71585.1 hypothetical protein AYR58_05305 [Pediococcus claussenii]KRN19741.1 hypothetical protein IV79_GL001028 [Pediococcus claussenii]
MNTRDELRQTYCEFFAIDPNKVRDDQVEAFFEKHSSTNFGALQNGYIEMAQLNRQITNDFSSCEAECEAHLLERF